jgi:chitodextrinase
MKKFTPFVLFVVFILSAMLANAQERTCATMEVLEQMKSEDPGLERRIQEIERHTETYVHGDHVHTRNVITIPVVVHVVWRTNFPVENISDAQVLSQIAVLNEDFGAYNADLSQLPALFQGVLGNAQIQFCMAQRDPNGNPTNGINRVQSSRTSTWGTNNAVKNPSQGGVAPWDATRYLNVWVCAIGGGILGYAQFPGGSLSTDGVVIDYRYYGTTGTATAPFNKGRTGTHEVGHWLNLRHIWGDATCGNDFVSDTPVHNAPNYGCPTFPHYSTCSGNPVEMTMNYMDYTDDACMYMFSAGQSTRMNAVLAPGGFRHSLLTSDGCTPPGSVCNVPNGLSASNITSSSATLGWSAVSGASSYNVRLRPTGTSTWSTNSTSSTSFNATGLSSSTTYEFQVQTVCGGNSSNWSASTNFTTQSAATCGTPAGLNATNITTNSAMLNWNSVSGASSYNVRLRPVGATTWTTGSTSGTSINATGLSSNTNYEFQVQAVCSVTGNWSASATFTTSGSTGCTDPYEPNNNSSSSTSFPLGSTIQALISPSGDQDWYRFNNTNSQRNIQAYMTNLPADYDMQLYRVNTLLVTSQNGGTNDELINYNTTRTGTHYIRVYGYNGANNSSNCYSLTINISSSSFRDGGEAVVLGDIEEEQPDFFIFPNPASSTLTMDIPVESEAPTRIFIYDMTGKLLVQQSESLAKGYSIARVDVSNLPNGMYVVRVQNGNFISNQKFIVSR